MSKVYFFHPDDFCFMAFFTEWRPPHRQRRADEQHFWLSPAMRCDAPTRTRLKFGSETRRKRVRDGTKRDPLRILQLCWIPAGNSISRVTAQVTEFHTDHFSVYISAAGVGSSRWEYFCAVFGRNVRMSMVRYCVLEETSFT